MGEEKHQLDALIHALLPESASSKYFLFYQAFFFLLVLTIHE